MSVTTEQIKQLREQTGVSITQCKKALEEADGDMEKAIMVLKKKSKDIATKKSDRTLGAGVVQAYIHAGGSVGAMVELSCETDFVAKNDEFKALAYDIAMHVAAMNPHFIKPEDISEDSRTEANRMFEEEVAGSGKPEEIKKKMLEGKLTTYFAERTLLEQPYVKNTDMAIKDLITDAVQKFGEKIEVTRMARFAVGA